MDCSESNGTNETWVLGTDGNMPVIKTKNDILRLELEELEHEYLEKAQNELFETSEVRKNAFIKLRELLKADDALRNIPLMDDAFLLKFLRPCKFYPESALKLMHNFQKFNEKNAKLCKQLLPSNEYNVFSQDLLTFLPKRDKHGRRIMIIQSGYKWIPKKCTLNEIFKAVMLSMQAAICEPRTQVSGVVVILDMEGLTLTHVWQFSPGFARNLLNWVQDCIPVRLKGVHIINQPYIFNMVFTIFKPFIIEKLRKRIHFHGEDKASLVNYIGSDCLPVRLGGTMNIPDIPSPILWELLKCYEKDYEYFNSAFNKQE